MSDKPRGGRGKAVVGGAGVLVLAAIYLGFKGFGLGPGDGAGDGSGEKNTNPSETNVAVENVGDVVVVLIDGGNYGMLKSPKSNPVDKDNYEATSLDKIVDTAKKVEGDSGVKVRIHRRGNAKASAENNLTNALIESGVDRTSMYVNEDTVP